LVFCAAGLGPAVTLVAVTFCGCDATAILILLALNGMFMGAQYAGNSMNLLMLAPNFSGTTLGISNTFANAAGILAPYAVGFLTNGNVSTFFSNSIRTPMLIQGRLEYTDTNLMHSK